MKNLDFQDKLDILLEKSLSSVAEQEYTMLYGKCRIKLQNNSTFWKKKDEAKPGYSARWWSHSSD